MESTKINRLKLLDIVRENLQKHEADYQESLKDYQAAMEKIAEQNKEIADANALAIKAGKLDAKNFVAHKGYPAYPTSYAKEYSRAIRMLELSVEENIDVEQHVFNQLVLDEWQWKQNFVATSALYKTLT